MNSRRSLSAFAHSGKSIAVGIMVMNVATYGYTMVAARVLGPQPYGAFASLMNTLLVVSVLQLGLQATAARRISADPSQVGHIERHILRLTYRAGLGLGLLLIVLTPVIDQVLKLESLATAALLGVTTIPMTIMGGQAGILQGERRWLPLAVLYLANGVPRLVIGTLLIVASPTEFLAMFGVMLGAFAPVVIGWWVLRRPRVEGDDNGEHTERSILREAVHNSQALLAFFALSNVDLIVARNVLDAHDSGLYAAGLILTKAVLFLPQFLVVVSFPAMSTVSERRRALTRSLALAGGLGLVAIAGSVVLGDIAMLFVGGDKYAEIQSRLWLFALIGTLLAMLQLLIYSVLARQGQRSIYAVWLALLAMVAVGMTADTVDGLLRIVVVADALLFVVLFGLSLRFVRNDPVETDPAPVL